ncbi:MAG: hypothetical protein JW722_04335 [Demequinaceae bacterium]|nr:hypothetical protein [Demequinaceae bacterium]
MIEVLWDGSKLPKPKLDGGRATYMNVYPGVDLVIDILPEGFESFFVVETKAALKSAPELALGFRVVGAEFVEDGLGGVRHCGFGWVEDWAFAEGVCVGCVDGCGSDDVGVGGVGGGSP